jgi:hypothetical protein
MKPKPYFRLIFILLPVTLVIAFLENKRQENIVKARRSHKMRAASATNPDTFAGDYIFFQSVNKCIYIPLVR